jgi:Tol biopolymer transport system component/DNA-binding winged helix-turn-helix (wHTH) protein
MDGRAKHLYQFGPFRLDVDRRLLLRSGGPVPLTPKAFDTLRVLVENSGQVIAKDELLSRVWPDSFVEEATLAQNVFTLRKALGDDGSEHSYIRTVPRRGYCFIGDVTELGGDEVIVHEHLISDVVIEEEIVDGKRAKSRRGLAWDGARSTHFPRGLLWIAAPLALAALAGLLYWLLTRGDVVRAKPFQHVSITRLTTEGRLLNAATSPDGKYIAYVLDEPGQLSLWVKQTGVAASIQIVPPDDVRYEELTFSLDSNSIYYVRAEDLYQTPTLGGISRKLVSGVGSSVSISPDGKRLAFIRSSTSAGKSSLIIADSDGTNEVTLSVRRAPDYYWEPAWSPDGKTIACSVGTRGEASTMTVVMVSVTNGAEHPLASVSWAAAGRLAWLPDGSGLIMSGRQDQSKASQLWLVSCPDGEVREITSGLGDYGCATVTSDAKAIVAVQRSKTTNLWVADLKDPDRIARITGGTNNEENPCFTPDGRIVFSAFAAGNRNIFIASADGANRKQLTFDPSHACGTPTVTPDGRLVVFLAETGNASSIWRTDIDGSAPRQLTSGAIDFDPTCTADGKWVIFARYTSGKPTLWKVGIDGGEAVKLTDKLSRHPLVSPDGKQLACYYWDEQRKSPAVIAIFPIDENKPVESFESPGGMSPTEFRWTPDGSGVAYAVNAGGISTIWLQPLAGGPPRKIAEFKGERVFFFDWSRDGRTLVCSRGASVSDAVMISDAR